MCWFVFLGLSSSSLADAPVRLFTKDRLPLNLHMYVLEDKTNGLSIDQVSSSAYDELFVKNEVALPNLGITTHTFWIRATLLYPATYPNVQPHKRWYLEVEKSLLNVAELYVPELDGAFQVSSSDLRIQWEQRPVSHIYSVFPIITYLDEELTFYLKIENKTSLRIPLVLWSQEGFAAKVAIEEFIYGTFFGGMLIMMIYNLFVYSSVKDVGYLYYVMYLSGVTYFEMLEVGHGSIHAGEIFQVVGKEFIPFIVLFSLFSGILFARTFLETHRLYKKIDTIFLLLLGAVSVSLFSNFLINFKDSVVWITTISSVVLCYMLIASAYAWSKGSVNAKFFFFAWNFNCFGFIIYSLMVNQILPSNTFTIMSAPLGVFFEAVILSFALANRIKMAQKSALDSDDEAMSNLSKYRSVFENSQEGMYQMTLQGVIKNANPSMASIMGMKSVGEVVENGNSVAAKLFDDGEKQLRILLDKGEMINELKFSVRGGGSRWLHHRAHLSYTSENDVISIKGAVIDMTEIKEKEYAIKKGFRERVDRNIATAAASEKSVFLSMMSHEIRTPLAAIIGYSESLQEGVFDKSLKKEYIDTVMGNSQNLLKIINNILDISKLESGRFAVENIDVDTGGLLLNIDCEFQKKSIQRGLHFNVEFASRLPSKIEGDPTRIRQIITNVCDNAVNFTTQGKVNVHVSWLNDSMSIVVVDTGVGVSDFAVRDLFELRNNEDGLDERCIKGAGLGLPVSRYLARIMGGDVEYKKGKREGSEFSISFRAKKSDGADWIDRLPDINEITSTVDKYNQKSTSKPTVPVPSLEGVVLLAEDNVVNQKLIKKLIEKTGVTVLLANDGIEACECCDKRLPDVVLMDINMPNRNGLEATAYIRAQGYARPIFALTAELGQKEVEDAISVGCQGVLSKPINKKEIYSMLENHLLASPPAIVSLNDERGGDKTSVSEIHPPEKLNPEVNRFTDELPQIEVFMRDLIEAKKWGRLRELSDQIVEVADQCSLLDLTTYCRCLSEALISDNEEDVNRWLPIVETELNLVAASEKTNHKKA
ncbi:hypothetical protein A9Q99_12680 [Gammaproteobacteria bacterium 45_16_T64]|nr:hypothetical protein A9Q99_12680 [Gammaproteobacteria bacterium 45_16_T64]